MIFINLNKREKIILTITVIVIGFGLLEKNIFSPIRKKMSASMIRQKMVEKKLEKFLSMAVQDGIVKSLYEKYAQSIMQKGSNEEEMGRFLSEIEKLGDKCLISIKNVKPEKIIDENDFNKYLVKLGIESRMNDFADFIYQLESFPRMFRVEEFTISPKNKNSFIMKISLTISEILIDKK